MTRRDTQIIVWYFQIFDIGIKILKLYIATQKKKFRQTSFETDREKTVLQNAYKNHIPGFHHQLDIIYVFFNSLILDPGITMVYFMTSRRATELNN